MFQEIIQSYQNIHQSNLEKELSCFSELGQYDEMILTTHSSRLH